MVLDRVRPMRTGVGPGKQTCNPVASSLRSFAHQDFEQVAGSLHAFYVILDAHIIPRIVSEDPGHACEDDHNHDYSFGTATHTRLTQLTKKVSDGGGPGRATLNDPLARRQSLH